MITIREILSGDFLKRGWFREQYKLVILICALILVYIYSGYRSLRQQHHLNAVKKELVDASNTQITIHTELMQYTRQSAVVQHLAERGSKLQENKTPVVHIEH